MIEAFTSTQNGNGGTSPTTTLDWFEFAYVIYQNEVSQSGNNTLVGGLTPSASFVGQPPKDSTVSSSMIAGLVGLGLAVLAIIFISKKIR
jgi:hypothetical protein